jgi:hypothetical protein
VGDRLTIPMESVFAPSGYDSQDRAQVTVQAQLPDSCYVLDQARGEVDASSRVVRLQIQALRTSTDDCATVQTPVTATLDLGELDPGSYQLLALDSRGNWVNSGRLPIATERRPMPDDLNYALIRSVSLTGHSSKQGPIPLP